MCRLAARGDSRQAPLAKFAGDVPRKGGTSSSTAAHITRRRHGLLREATRATSHGLLGPEHTVGIVECFDVIDFDIEFVGAMIDCTRAARLLAKGRHCFCGRSTQWVPGIEVEHQQSRERMLAALVDLGKRVGS